MNKKIIVGSFVSVITLLVCSTALSFAWYDTSDVLKIDNMEVSLSGDEDLLIGLKKSSKKSDYKSVIEQSELKTVDKFKPVSSMCSNNWMKDKAKDPTFYDSYDMGDATFVPGEPGYVLPVETKATSGYFSQELYLYSEHDYAAVLDENTFLVPDLEKNKAQAKKFAEEHPEMGTEAEILAQLNALVNSARISVLVTTDDFYAYKIIDPYRQSNAPTLLGGTLDTDLDGIIDYWTKADQTKYEILFGEVNDRSKIIYDFNEEDPEPLPNEERTWYNAKHAKDTNIIDLDASSENGLEIKQECALSVSENAALTERLLSGGVLTPKEKEAYLYMPVEAFTPTRIVLSIYFEGWDFDNINSTMAASFKTDIGFKAIDKALLFS